MQDCKTILLRYGKIRFKIAMLCVSARARSPLLTTLQIFMKLHINIIHWKPLRLFNLSD
jgi:hypothetical protein